MLIVQLGKMLQDCSALHFASLTFDDIYTNNRYQYKHNSEPSVNFLTTFKPQILSNQPLKSWNHKYRETGETFQPQNHQTAKTSPQQIPYNSGTLQPQKKLYTTKNSNHKQNL